MKYTFIFLFIFSSLSISAQNSWEKLIKTETDEVLYNCFELINNNFIFSGCKDIYTAADGHNYSKKEYLLKTDRYGTTIKEKTFEKTDSFFNNVKIYPLNDTIFIVFASAGTEVYPFVNIHTIYVQKFDTAFNLLNEKSYKIPFDSTDISGFKITENYNGNMILAGSVKHKPSITLDMFFWEFNKEGDSIKSKFYTDTIPTWSLAFKILEKKDTSGYYCLAKRLAFSPAGIANRILELDYDFNQLKYKFFPVQIDNNGDFAWFNDTTFISTGIFNGDLKSQQRDLGVITIDTSFNTYNYNYFGFQDTAEVMAPDKSLIFNEGDSYIYLAGISNYDIYSGSFGQLNSTIQFVKTDLNLQPIFEKYYKGDACYYTSFFNRTNDGGFLFLTTRYDYQTQDKERDIFILKVDSLGNLPASSINEPEFTAHDLILYPNPGSNLLHLRTAVQSTGGSFNLLDITGKKVLQKNITTTNTLINTQNLPAGVYIYSYILKGKIIETGKWIKQ